METSVSLLERLTDRPTELDWQRLFELYQPLLRSWALRAGVNDADADDLVQETLTVVVREVPSFDRGRTGAFRSWLRTILVHRLRAFFRARKYRPIAAGGSDFHDRLEQLSSPDSALSKQWDREHDLHVANRVMKLVEVDVEPLTWQAFRRHVLDDLPAAAVALELGVTYNVVKLAKSRVLQRLRTALAGLLDC